MTGKQMRKTLLIVCTLAMQSCTLVAFGASKVEVVTDSKAVQEARERFRQVREKQVRELIASPTGVRLYDSAVLAKLKDRLDLVVPALRAVILTTQPEQRYVIRVTRPDGQEQVYHASSNLLERQLASIAILTMLDDPVGTQTLTAVLRDGTAKQRAAALGQFSLISDRNTCAFMHTEAFRDVLRPLLDDPDPQLWHEAMWSARWLNLPELKDVVTKRWNNRANDIPEDLLEFASEYVPTLELVVILGDRLAADKDAYKWLRRLSISAERGDSEVRARVAEIVAAHVRKNLSDRDISEAVRLLASTAGQAQLPLLHELIERPNFPASDAALTGIARIEGQDSADLLRRSLDDRHLRNTAVKLLGKLKHGKQDAQTTAALAKAAADAPTPRPFNGALSLELVCDALLDIGGSRAEEAVRRLLPRLRPFERWECECRLRGWNAETVCQRLEQIGIAPAPTSKQRNDDPINQIGESSLGWQILGFLATRGVFSGFDGETGEVPSPHDELLVDLAGITNGSFTPEACLQWDHEKRTEDDEPGSYHVQFVFREHLYRFEAENHGDWWDFASVMDAANAALADHHIAERLQYVPIDGPGILFANPEAVTRAQEEGLLPRYQTPASPPGASSSSDDLGGQASPPGP